MSAESRRELPRHNRGAIAKVINAGKNVIRSLDDGVTPPTP